MKFTIGIFKNCVCVPNTSLVHYTQAVHILINKRPGYKANYSGTTSKVLPTPLTMTLNKKLLESREYRTALLSIGHLNHLTLSIFRF